MKRSGKSIIIGLFFLALAGLYLSTKVLGIVFSIPWITILLSLLFGYIMFKSFKKKDFIVGFIFLGLLYGQLHKYIGLQSISFGTIIVFAILVGIGLQLIFKSDNYAIKVYDENGNYVEKEKYSQDVIDSANGEDIRVSVCFGETIKYISSKSLDKVSMSNSFGQLICYFNEAVTKDKTAIIKVENSFGETKLYIPKDWRINVERDNAFGNISVHGNFEAYEDPTEVTIIADNAFGAINIYYV